MRRLIGIGLAGAILAACSMAHGATATTASTPGPVAVGNLLATAVAPPGSPSSRTFTQAGLGASLSIPSSWRTGGPRSGFRFAAYSPRAPYDFVLADSHPALAPDAAVLAQNRARELASFSAVISSVATGTVEGLPAVRLRYLIGSGEVRAQDLEYDILSGSAVVLLVIGTPASRPDISMVNWIASTIKV